MAKYKVLLKGKKKATFWRGGIKFNREFPVEVDSREVGKDKMELILSEPLLECTPVEEDADRRAEKKEEGRANAKKQSGRKAEK